MLATRTGRGQVGVHLDDHVVAALESDREACPVRGPEAALRRPTQDVDVAELASDRLGKVTRTVGAVVVDDEHMCAGDRVMDAPQDVVKVRGLLVGRDDDQRLELAGREA